MSETPIAQELATRRKQFIQQMLRVARGKIPTNALELEEIAEACWKLREQDELKALQVERELALLIEGQKKTQVAYLRELPQFQAGGSATFLDVDGETRELIELAVNEKIRNLIQEGVPGPTTKGREMLGKKLDKTEGGVSEDNSNSPRTGLFGSGSAGTAMDMTQDPKENQKEVSRLAAELQTQSESHTDEVRGALTELRSKQGALLLAQEKHKSEEREMKSTIAALVREVHNLKDIQATLTSKLAALKKKNAETSRNHLKPWVDILNPEGSCDPSEGVRGRTASRKNSEHRALILGNPLTPDILPVKPYRPAMFTPAKPRKTTSPDFNISEDVSFSRFMRSSGEGKRRVLIGAEEEEFTTSVGDCDPHSLKSVLVGRPMP